MSRQFSFRDDPLFLHNSKDADPQVIGDALDAIAEANGGLLTPQATVAAARRRGHPLNRHFEWRDKQAADKYRLDQARQLIRVIRVVSDEEPQVKHYAYVNVRAEQGRAYMSPTRIIDSSLLQARALEMAERELAALERRYAEIADLCRDIAAWRGRLSQRRQELLSDRPNRVNYG